jgi:hypothetical protein
LEKDDEFKEEREEETSQNMEEKYCFHGLKTLKRNLR